MKRLIELFENNYFIIQNISLSIYSTLNNHHQYRMVGAVGFINSFYNYQLTVFSARWRLSAGRTGQAKAIVNNSGLDGQQYWTGWSTIVDLVNNSGLDGQQ